MSLRKWMNENSTLATAVVGGVLFVALLIMVFTGGSEDYAAPTGFQAYFYDLNEQELFTADADLLPPIEAPSGPHEGKPAGVRAYVHSCGECDDDEWKYYLETYTETVKQQIQKQREEHEARTGTPMMMQGIEYTEAYRSGILIKRPDDTQWVTKASPEGKQILDEITRCGQGFARLCSPN